jgi:predicted RNase H-like HicB family nuclease
MGGSKKTRASEEFKTLVADTEKQAATEISEAIEIYVNTLSKQEESKGLKGKKMPWALV